MPAPTSGVGEHDQRRTDHEGAGMADPAHQRRGEEAAGDAAGRQAGEDQPGPGRRIAGRAEADRDIGKHQPVADCHQRHRHDDAGDRQHRRRLRVAVLPFACCRSSRPSHAARLHAAAGRRSGKSDIGRARRNWTGRIGGLDQRGALPRPGSRVDDSDERGPWMKVQAGACMRARIGASPSSTRA